VSALDRACEAAGRDPAGVQRCVRRLALVGEDEADLRRKWERARGIASGPPPAATLEEFRAGRLVGTVEQVGEQLASWAGAGVTTLVVALGALPFATTDGADLGLLASAAPPG
ncbi:MAG: hypothetical protein M3Q48_15140, partial [Actinomycetota bacterium]|nr:hypothetical protein [Actinomycetota bacterium]